MSVDRIFSREAFYYQILRGKSNICIVYTESSCVISKLNLQVNSLVNVSGTYFYKMQNIWQSDYQ